jgi:hypothetical protein
MTESPPSIHSIAKAPNDEKHSGGSEPRSSISNPVEEPPVHDARPHSGIFGHRKSASIVDDEKSPTNTPEAGSLDFPPVSLSAMFRCVQNTAMYFRNF